MRIALGLLLLATCSARQVDVDITTEWPFSTLNALIETR
jgi:hypothetical protein